MLMDQKKKNLYNLLPAVNVGLRDPEGHQFTLKPNKEAVKHHKMFFI